MTPVVKTPGKLRVIPLGGLGEIGKNITAFETENDIIIVDCGITFPDDSMPGIDAVIPDFTYLENNFSKIRGIFVTHGHEDHIGALPYFLKKINVPIYSLKFTIALIKRKLEEEEMYSDSVHLEEVHYGDIVIKGDFAVEFIRTNHSIADSCALAIMSPSGVVIHTGDFKVDYTPIDNAPIDLMRLAELGENGVLLLMSDSTNAERKGFTMSERTVGAAFDDLFAKITGRIIVATFSSNIHRVQQIIDTAAKFGRKCAICGRSMVNVVEVACEIGYIKAEETIIDIEDAVNYPDNEIVIITTGSQGEPMSALTRMAGATHNQVEVSSNDTIIISASPIPGNEKAIAKMIDELFKRGANVIYKALADVHVSGHACEEELKLILTITKPRYFMPVHGEYRHLIQHANIAKHLNMPAEDIFIMGNGNVLEFRGPDLVIREEQVESGNILIDGIGVGDVGNMVLKDRRHLAEDGLLAISVAVSSKTLSIVAGPDIVSRGFVYMKDSENIITKVSEIVKSIIADTSQDKYRVDWNAKKLLIRDTVKAYIMENTKRNPMILPIVMEIDEE